MTKACTITGKTIQTGNNVSHSKRRTKRRFMPNLQNFTFVSEILGESFRMRVTTHAIRSVEKNGGLDSFLMKAKNSELAEDAIKIKRKIKKKVQEQAS